MVKEETKRKWLNLLWMHLRRRVAVEGGKWGGGSSLPNDRSSTGFGVCQSIRLMY